MGERGRFTVRKFPEGMFVMDDFGDYPGREKVREAIEAGLVVTALNRHGHSSLRTDGDVIRGRLRRSSAVAAAEDPALTEDTTFDEVEAALDWFEESYRATHR